MMAAAARSEPAPLFDDLTVLATDGEPLAARYYRPAAQPRGAVLIAPAMGVPQRFYAPFAEWLAGAGYHAITFDYRGTGLSRRGSLRGFDADVITWGERDGGGVLRWLADRVPRLPITWIGHSLGGQILPFVADRSRLARAITIATGSGYWRDNAPPLKRKVWLFWWLAVPLATPLFGYFPGKRLGMVGDLPRGVIRQWRRWCMHPEYAAGAEGDAVRGRYAAVTTPMTWLSFTDDEMMSEASIDGIRRLYTTAPHDVHRLAPADLGLDRIGHFGCFRPEMRAPLWERFVLPALPA